jgi:tight adherence protein B
VRLVADTFWSSTLALYLVVGIVFLFCIALGWLLFGTAARRKSDKEMAKRMRSAGRSVSTATQASATQGGWIPQGMSQFGTRFADAGGFSESLDMRLEAAGVKVRSGEFVVASVVAGLVAAFVGIAIFQAWLFGIIFAAGGGVAPWVLLNFSLGRRADRLREQLPDVLTIMASSLRAGHSFLQSLDTVSKEIPEPAASEFIRVVAEVRLGRPVEDALEALAERVGSEDFKWAVLAVNIQREVGGNLAEILDTVADTLRERAVLRRQVRVLTTEGRLSAWVLTILPFVIALYMFAVNREYIMLLFTTTIGWVMTIGAMGLLTLGILWMRKIVKIDV